METKVKEFRREELEELAAMLNLLTLRVHKYAEDDPYSSMCNARKIAEAICDLLLVRGGTDEQNLPEKLKNKIEVLSKAKKIPVEIEAHTSTLLIWGNLGAHFRSTEPTKQDIIVTLRCVQGLTDWFCKEYQFDPIPWSDSTAKALPASNSSAMLNPNQIPLNSVAFISEVMKDPQNVESVSMAFHLGAEWRNDSQKVELINFMQRNNIPLYVIVNNGATINKICKHMKQEGKEYVGFARGIRQWHNAQEKSNRTIQVRVSNLPLLHRIYIVRYKNQTGAVNVKFYTYGNSIPDNDFRAAFSSNTKEYVLYAKEFDHLWENASPLPPSSTKE